MENKDVENTSEDTRPVIDLLELMRKVELEQLCIKHKAQLEAIRQRNIETAQIGN